MANKMHDDWLKVKAHFETQVKNFKKNGGLNTKQIEDALKSFDSGFGPLLDKTGKAFKDKKDADIKKNAAAALVVANKYLETVKGISNERGTYAKMELNLMIKRLTELKDKGAGVTANYFE